MVDQTDEKASSKEKKDRLKEAGGWGWLLGLSRDASGLGELGYGRENDAGTVPPQQRLHARYVPESYIFTIFVNIWSVILCQ